MPGCAVRGDVLKVVEELEERAVAEEELGFGVGQRAGHEIAVGEHRAPAFGEADAEHVDVTARGATLLIETPALAAVDGQEAEVDVGEDGAGVLPLDHLHQPEHLLLVRVGRLESRAPESSRQPLVRRPLGRGIDVGAVERSSSGRSSMIWIPFIIQRVAQGLEERFELDVGIEATPAVVAYSLLYPYTDNAVAPRARTPG